MRTRFPHRLIPFNPRAAALLLGLPLLGQSATISNPGGPGLLDFPATAPGWVMNFSQMNWGALQGKLTLNVYGVRVCTDTDGPRPIRVPKRTSLLSTLIDPPSGQPYNAALSITQAEARSLGVPQATLDAYLNTNDPDEGPGFQCGSPNLFKTYVGTLPGSETQYAFTNQGNLVMMVDFPEAGPWALVVTDAHRVARSSLFQVPAPGVYGIQINGVYTGNVRAALEAQSGHYSRTEPMVLRKGKTTGAGLRFVNANDPAHYYTIRHLSLGQGSQDEAGALPLVASKDAMVRLMLQDSNGAFQTVPNQPGVHADRDFKVRLSYGTNYPSTTLGSETMKLSWNPVGTGVKTTDQKPFVIPGTALRSGLRVRAELLDVTSGAVVHTKEIAPEVRQGQVITIHPFSVKVEPGGSGAPVGRNENNGFYLQLARWAEDRFPAARIVVLGGRTLESWILSPASLLPNSEAKNGAILLSTMALMNSIAAAEGVNYGNQHHLYVGVINGKYQSAWAQGMAFYGHPGIAMYMQEPHEMSGYVLAHEMGHAYGLYHAPSPDADKYLLGFHANRVNYDFPYSANGLAAGYGYSALNGWYNKEIDWNHDPMSYGSPLTASQMYFSDFFYRGLVDQMTRTLPPPVSTTPAPRFTFPRNADGSYRLDSSQVNALQSWLNGRLQGLGACSGGATVEYDDQGRVVPRVAPTGVSAIRTMMPPGDGGTDPGDPAVPWMRVTQPPMPTLR